jgi:hypothetical protein
MQPLKTYFLPKSSLYDYKMSRIQPSYMQHVFLQNALHFKSFSTSHYVKTDMVINIFLTLLLQTAMLQFS